MQYIPHHFYHLILKAKPKFMPHIMLHIVSTTSTIFFPILPFLLTIQLSAVLPLLVL